MFSVSKNEREAKPLKPNGQDIRSETPGGKAPQDVVSTFGRGMFITGNIVCAGAVQVFGRVAGDIHAAHLVICEGGKVEGKITAQEAVIQGAFNGTIHGNSVKLLGTAVVEGEVYNKSLTIEENAQFEGVSRRLERPVEAPAADQVNGAEKGFPPSVAALAPHEPIG